jgi:glycosyltransferase involved in cell wall biosynthesis
VTIPNGFLVVCPTAPGWFDGVADYAASLAARLLAYGHASLLGLPEASSRAGDTRGAGAVPRVIVTRWRELWRRRREPAFDEPAVLLQYVPQLYLCRTDFVWLLLWLARQRWRGRAVVVTVHEYAVPAGSIRQTIVRLLLNGVMLVIGSLASHLVVTFEVPRRRLRRLLFWKAQRITLIPVGSNIPMSAGPTGPAASGPVACVIFGQPEAMSPPVVAALGSWLQERGRSVRIRWIARSRQAVRSLLERQCGTGADALEIVERAPAQAVSNLLASSDLCLAPIVDGVSTRRTTIMAALAHGLPIVGTDGICTDDVLRSAEACLLAAPADGAAFIRHAQALVADAPRRARMGQAARALFDAQFSWDRIARAYLAHLGWPIEG